jgi:hypothetical protein
MRLCLVMALAGVLLAGCARQRVPQEELYTQIYPIAGTEVELGLIDRVLDQEWNRMPGAGAQYVERTADRQVRVRTTPQGHVQIREGLSTLQARRAQQPVAPAE